MFEKSSHVLQTVAALLEFTVVESKSLSFPGRLRRETETLSSKKWHILAISAEDAGMLKVWVFLRTN